MVAGMTRGQQEGIIIKQQQKKRRQLLCELVCSSPGEDAQGVCARYVQRSLPVPERASGAEDCFP